MKKKGFTLIELMVVIAIIGILAGLILPVLAKSRKEARRKANLSNIDQIGKALILYSTRYNGLFPDPRTDVGPRKGEPADISKALNMLYCQSYIADPRVFVSPLPEGDGKIPTPGKWEKWGGDWSELKTLNSSNFNPDYAYSIGHKDTDDVVIVVGDRLTVRDKPTRKHESRGVHVLYADCGRKELLGFKKDAVDNKDNVTIPPDIKKSLKGTPDRIFTADEDFSIAEDSILINPNL